MTFEVPVNATASALTFHGQNHENIKQEVAETEDVTPKEEVVSEDDEDDSSGDEDEDTYKGVDKNEFSRHFAASTMVRVKIKGRKDTYLLHSTLLEESSYYFSGCLSSLFQEGLSSDIELDLEDDLVIPFTHYVEFIYTGDYRFWDRLDRDNPEPVPTEKKVASKLGETCMDQASLHARTFVLAERLLCNELRVASLDKLMYVLFTAIAYPPQPDNAKRKLVKDQYRESCFSSPGSGPNASDAPLAPLIPMDALSEIMKQVYEGTPPQTLPYKTRTSYCFKPEDSNIRDFLAVYCAYFWNSCNQSKVFMDFLFGTREAFDDIMLYHAALSRGFVFRMTTKLWKLSPELFR